MSRGSAGLAADVVVVGAGLAGLTAARRLVAAGRSVVVLEARDRVGGRTLSVERDGHVFDLGGQWLGPTQRRMHALARELGLDLFPQHCAGAKILDVRGQITSYTGAIPSLPPHALVELQLALWRMNQLARRVPLDRPWEAVGADGYDRRSVEDFKRRNLRSRRVRAVFDAAVRTVFGAEPAEINLLYFLAYLQAGGGFLQLVEIEGAAQQDRVVAGAQQFSVRIAHALGDRVVLDSPVHAITQDDAGVTVHGRRAWRCGRAIVALPPALAGRLAYEPGLATGRQQLLQRIPMGITIKCIALYERPFWRDAGWSGEVVADRDPFAVVFDDSSHDGGVAALLGFVVGDAARRWGTAPAQSRERAVIEAFVRYFGEHAARPIGYLEHDWASEPWSGGCPVGVVAPGVLASCGQALRAPMGRVHWAGTETATEWTGYMEGAVESGERAAREVVTAAP